MKKMMAFVMVLALVCTNVPANLHVQTGTETVYAAQETAINSEQDLIAMQNNPKGKYYLAKDITITKKLNMFPDYKDDNGDYRVDSFMGTLDGKGHKIKNYAGIGLFDNAKNATFKNIIMTNVTIEGTESAAALVYSATKCTFTNITVSGSTKTAGAGIVLHDENCNFTDCTSKVDANIKAESKEIWISFAGISQGSAGSTFKNCKNKGNLKVTSESVDDLSYKLYGITSYAKSMENCSNSGNITIVNTEKNDPEYGPALTACGVIEECRKKITGCSNTGNISVTNKGGKKSTTRAKIAGVFSSSGKAASRCYNTGNISYKGACTDYSLDKAIWVQGVGTGNGTSECYNTGKITVKLTSGTACVGGVSYAGTKLKNCYNTGAVSLTGNGLVGGIAAEFYSGYSNYNTGKISGKGKTLYKGEIAGNAGYSYLDGVTVYDNYYTGSGKKSGSESTSWKPYQSKAKKVSSITFGNCSKLSSKYWTYSNKHKRLILKNNKEA